MPKHIIINKNGIDRKLLPNFKYLGNITQDMADEVIEFTKKYNNINDFENEKYSAVHTMNLCEQKPELYRQILLQELKNNEDDSKYFDSGYSVWNTISNELSISNFIKEKFDTAWRTRIAILPAYSELPWHIDTNTSLASRITINISEISNVFEIDRKNEIEAKNLDSLSIYFTNTGYKHRVINNTNEPRICILFSCDSKTIF